MNFSRPSMLKYRASVTLDLERGALARAVPMDWAAFLAQRGGVLDQTVDGSAEAAAIPIPAALLAKLATSAIGGDAGAAGDSRNAPPVETTPGSNAFAVAGSRTRDGRAVVGNDMHLSHSAPGFWYRVALVWPEGFLAGVSLPGVPLVVQGTNGHVAWGFTNLTADLADLVLIDPAPVGRTPADGARAIATESIATESIATESIVEIGPPAAREAVTIGTTPFGPILGALPDGTPYAWRWALAEDAGVDCGLFRLCFARTLDEALDAAAGWRGDWRFQGEVSLVSPALCMLLRSGLRMSEQSQDNTPVIVPPHRAPEAHWCAVSRSCAVSR